MKDLNSIFTGLNKSGLLSGFAGGLAGGAASTMLTSKTGLKVGKSALKIGALAAVGGIAWKAYQSYSQKKSAQTVQQAVRTPASTYSPQSLSRTQFESIAEQKYETSHEQMLLLRAMITAANADGYMDSTEQQRIFEQVSKMELSVADKASLFDELRRPLSVEQLVEQVPNPHTAVEVYAASLLAINQRQPASSIYLSRLAQLLSLPRDLVGAIHQQVASEVAA
jgi:uncharacterized membrane protein YebE (DUF533 family)